MSATAANASATAAAASASAAAGDAAMDRKGGADAAGVVVERKTSKERAVVVARNAFGDEDFELDEGQLASYRKFMADYGVSREALAQDPEQKKNDDLKKFMDTVGAYDRVKIESASESESLPPKIKAIFIAIADGRYDLARIILAMYLREENGLRKGEPKDQAEKEKDLKEKEVKRHEDKKPDHKNPLTFLVKMNNPIVLLKGGRLRSIPALSVECNATVVYFAVCKIHYQFPVPEREDPEFLEGIFLIMDLILAGCPVNTNLLGRDKNTALHWLVDDPDRILKNESYNRDWLNLLMFVLFANKEQDNSEGLLDARSSSDINIFSQPVAAARPVNALTVLMSLFESYPSNGSSCGEGHHKFFQQAVFLLLYGENYDYFALPGNMKNERNVRKSFDVEQHCFIRNYQHIVKVSALDKTHRFIHADMARACLEKFLRLPFWRYRQILWTLQEFYGPFDYGLLKDDPVSLQREREQRLTCVSYQGDINNFQFCIVNPALQIRNRGYFEGAHYRMVLEDLVGLPLEVWMIVKKYELRVFIPAFMQDGYDYAASVHTPLDISADKVAELISQTEIIDSPYEEVVAAINRSSNFIQTLDNTQFAKKCQEFLSKKLSIVYPYNLAQNTKLNKKDRTCYQYHSATFLTCPPINYVWYLKPEEQKRMKDRPLSTRAVRYFSVERSDKHSDRTLVRFWQDSAATKPYSDDFLFLYRPAQSAQAQKGKVSINASTEAKGLQERFMLYVGVKPSRIADRFSPVIEEDETDRKDENDQKRVVEAAAAKPSAPAAAKPVVSTAKGNASKQPAAGASKIPVAGVAARKSKETYFLFKAYLEKQTAQRELALGRSKATANAQAHAPARVTLQINQIFAASASKQGGKLQVRF